MTKLPYFSLIGVNSYYISLIQLSPVRNLTLNHELIKLKEDG